MKIQDAVLKESIYVATSTAIGVIIMILCFVIGNHLEPALIPFNSKVIAGGIVGGMVAAGNFFWMALTVQKVVSVENDDRARKTMALSYRYRTLTQLVWVVLAIFLPVFNAAAGIIPLFIPSLTIKFRGILSARKGGKKLNGF
ncbi:ATP synthase I chain [Lachnospiraceae bacterium]|nr:ATP synthase I chain [Lachnospiraceae bacterium]